MMQMRTCLAFQDLGNEMLFWSKNVFLACFEGFAHFSCLIHIDDNGQKVYF